ncbi:MAG: ATP synthase subunit C [Spirochaetaceae bacterium]|jgi:V/A-type H+-transporting ATPase subunit K|nr:ATP synthase subunit C [Spirochaetaceae bacterium]
MKGRVVVFIFVLFALSAVLFAGETPVEAGEGVSAQTGNTSIWKYFAAAAAVGISCIAGGIAVGQIGAAAMGAMSENPELSGKALPYAGLAEGICLWGFLVALLILIL